MIYDLLASDQSGESCPARHAQSNQKGSHTFPEKQRKNDDDNHVRNADDNIPSLTVDEPMSARIPRDNGISGTFLIVLKTLYAGATSKVF